MRVDSAINRLVPPVRCLVLGIALFFPFLYYPVATGLRLGVAPLGDVYKYGVLALTALLTVTALGLLAWQRRSELGLRLEPMRLLAAPETWFGLFLVWLAVVSALQREPSTVQNIIVYTVFIGVVVVTATGGTGFMLVLRVFVWIFAGILIAVGLWEAIGDPLASDVARQLGGPRLYASYGVIAVVGLFAIPMATWLRLALGGGLFAGAVISSSRSSMTTLLVVLVVGVIVTAPHFWRRVAVVVPAGLAAFVVALQMPWLRVHMAVSHITTPGAPIDDSGRGRVWIPTLESWTTQPVVGLGAGSSQTVSRESDFPLDHPHSEYLRILHDSGLIGFVLFAAFVLLALIWLWPRAGGKPRGELVVAGFLIVVAGLVLGTIENYLVFPSLMWPSAVFLGLGLAAARRDGQSLLDPRRRVRAASNENTELPQT